MPSTLSALSELKLFLRLAVGLHGFARRRLTPDECRRVIQRNLAERADNFLKVMRLGVFARPQSPYRTMMSHAGIAMADVERVVRADGVEPALEMLFDAGVHLSLDEFKGRCPVRRGSLTLDVTSRDFDNPLSAKHFATTTGGSRGTGTRVYIDLASYAQEAAYHHGHHAAGGFLDRPLAVWCPAPPYNMALNELMRGVKLGRSAERWYAQSVPRLDASGWKYAVLTGYLISALRLHGSRIPWPEHVPVDEAHRVAEWLAAKRRAGTPALLMTTVSSGVRTCNAAREAGLDISGSVIRVHGEPLTPGRAEVFHAAGCVVRSIYAMSEAGMVGVPCARPDAVDDLHLVQDKLALIRRRQTMRGGQSVLANIYTTLLPATPKLMLNVATDDYSVVERRSCGCALGELGYDTHLHTIRSYDKLTSEGMNFLGHDLIRLIEDVLPGRFGGSPINYQLAETDENGLPKVDVLVDPSVGPIDEGAVVETITEFLSKVPGASGSYGEHWRAGRTLRVIRRQPYATGAQKVLALHMVKPQREPAETPRPAA